MSNERKRHLPSLDDNLTYSFINPNGDDSWLNEGTTRSLEYMRTPESKVQSKRKNLRNDFNTVRKKESSGPLEEARQRQGGSAVASRQVYYRPAHHEEIFGINKRPKTSHGRLHDLSIGKSNGVGAFASVITRSVKNALGERNTLMAQVMRSVSNDMRRNNADIVDLCDEGTSSTESTQSQILQAKNQHGCVDRVLCNPGSPNSLEGSTGSIGPPRQATHHRHKSSPTQLNLNAPYDDIKVSTCKVWNGEGKKSVASVLATINNESYNTKHTPRKPVVPILPDVNALTLGRTRRMPEGVKQSNEKGKQQHKHQSFSFSKVNGNLPFGKLKGNRITIGSTFLRKSGGETEMQKITQKDAIVNLDDEYFDDNEQKTATKHASCASGQWYWPEKPSKEFEFSLARLFIGVLSFSSNCKLRVNDHVEHLVLSYSTPESPDSSKHIIRFEDVEEIKYTQQKVSTSVDDEEEISIFILRIKPTTTNGLKGMTSYLQHSEIEDPAKKYIILDLRNNDEFGKVLAQLTQVAFFKAFFTENSNKLKEEELATYACSLLTKLKLEAEGRRKSLGSTKKFRDTRTRKKTPSAKDNDILLVFPFGATDEAIDAAAYNLGEAAVGCNPNSEGNVSYITARPSKNYEANDEAESTTARAHYLTIRQEDRERLDGAEFLNDTLIDFWMQWMRRKENPVESSIHVFTSHFYSSLAKGGPKAVESWTAKKDIDVFRKKMIFIPINKNLHWSLCVVVNSKEIGRKLKNENDPLPCILFFDSLKAHKKDLVAKKVNSWLNAEWKRLNMSDSSSNHLSRADDPFNTTTMKVFAPKIPYQSNSWDCGVFVCRYAYALFKTRHNIFTVFDSNNNFQKSITDNGEFKFNMRDIARIRREFGTLVDGLAAVYACWKQEETHKANEEHERKREGFLSLEQIKEEQADGISFV